MESHFPIPDRKKLREKSYRGKCGPMLLISNVERGPVNLQLKAVAHDFEGSNFYGDIDCHENIFDKACVDQGSS